jgi:hypothetical protein
LKAFFASLFLGIGIFFPQFLEAADPDVAPSSNDAAIVPAGPIKADISPPSPPLAKMPVVVPKVPSPSLPATKLPDPNPHVVHGSLKVHTAGASMHLHPGSGKTVADYKGGFNIGSAADVTVHMGPRDAMLARDTSGDVSRIAGCLNIPQGFFVLGNKEGVAIHKGAFLDIDKFAAVGGDVSVPDFLDSKLMGQGTASIHNAGTVYIKKSGFFGLFGAGSVTQSGLILGEKSTVSLASGERTVLAFPGNELVAFVLPAEQASKASTVTVEKEGRIETQGGDVYLTAQGAAGVVESIVSVKGVVSASHAREVGGKIIFDAGDHLDISGKVETKGKQAGDILLAAENINLTDEAVLDATGIERAGEIQIGGRRVKSGKEAFLWTVTDVTAREVHVAENVRILARRLGSGKEGYVFLIAQDTMDMRGTVDVRTWGEGDGAFVELSQLTGDFDVSQVDMNRLYFKNYGKGSAGRFMLDPASITIGTGDGEVPPSVLATALASGDVIVTATGSTTVASTGALSWNSQYSLLLAATDADVGMTTGGTLTIGANITMAGAGNLLLYQGGEDLSDSPVGVTFENGAKILSTGDNANYVVYSVPENNAGPFNPIAGGNLGSGIGGSEGDNTVVAYLVTRTSSSGIEAFRQASPVVPSGIGPPTSSGVHLTSNINFAAAEDGGSGAISSSNTFYLTAFQIATDNFTESGTYSGMFSGTGNAIGQNTLTITGTLIPMFGAITSNSLLSHVSVDFDGNLSDTSGAILAPIARSVSGSTSFIDRLNSYTVGTLTGTDYVAGMIGRVISGAVFINAIGTSGNNATFSIGNITGGQFAVGSFIGGLVGRNAGILSISRIEAGYIGSIQSPAGLSVGGLVGESSSALSLTDITMNKIGTTTSDPETLGLVLGGSSVGGLVGAVSAGTAVIDGITLSSMGAVEQVALGVGVGGLIGAITNGATVNINDVNVTTFGNVSSYDNMAAYFDNAGGLIGYASGATPKLSIRNSTFGTFGTVTGKDNVGGLIGYQGSVEIDASNVLFDTITVTGSLPQIVSTGSYAGGLIGNVAAVSTLNTLVIPDIGQITGGSQVGGWFGIVSATTTLDGYTGNSLSDVSGSGSYVGGLIGQAAASVTVLDATISNSGVGDTGLAAVYGSTHATSGNIGGLIGAVTSGTTNLSITLGGLQDVYAGAAVGSAAINNDFVGGVVGFVNIGASLILTSFSQDSMGSISGYNYVGGLAGAVYGTMNIISLEASSITAVEGSSYIGGIVGNITGSGSVSITEALITGDNGILSVTGASQYTGGLAGRIDGSGIFNISDAAISKIGAVSTSGSNAAGLIGGNDSTSVNLSNLTIRSLTATGLNFAKGAGTQPITLGGQVQIMGINLGTFDSDNITFAEGAYGAISGQVATLPGSLIDSIPTSLLLRFYDGHEDTFYQLGGSIPDFSSSVAYSVDSNTLLSLLPQESNGLPYSVIQFGTVDGESVTYETYDYSSSSDQAAYVFNSETTTLQEYEAPDVGGLISPVSESTTTTAAPTSTSPDLSSELEVTEDFGEGLEIEGEVTVDDDLAEVGDDEVAEAAESELNELNQQDTDVDNDNDGDDLDIEQEQEEAQQRRRQKSKTKNRLGGDLLSLLEDKNNDDVLDASEIIRQR